MFGADVSALRRFASVLARHGHDVDATRHRLATVVETLPWRGLDRDHFVDEWRRRHGPALTAVADDLGRASREASLHADRQERASAPDR